MKGKVPGKIYAPATAAEIAEQLQDGIMPEAFTRRMRVINLVSATMINKLETDLLSPFDVIDLHHILDRQISQDAILAQMDSGGISYACATGNMDQLPEIAADNPALLRGLQTNWIQRFIITPFDPLCVMLAMRAKLLLDLIDELGHSYNLLRSIGWGWIDFGEIDGEDPGDPGDYYPPEMNDPIQPPAGPITADGDGDGQYPPLPVEGEDGYAPPSPIRPGKLDNLGDTYSVSVGPQVVGGAAFASRPFGPIGGDPCADKDNPEQTVTISYTSQQMQTGEEQDLSVSGNNPRWSASNYTWKISGGGGTLEYVDEGTGGPIYGPEDELYDEEATVAAFTVKYTAPASNPECSLNPTIELWCGDALMASLQIAINEYSNHDFVAWVYGYCHLNTGGPYAGYYFLRAVPYYCDGAAGAYQAVGPNDGLENCEALVANDPFCDGNILLGWKDCRTASKITAGCCYDPEI